MRCIRLAGGLALALALGGRAVADPAPYSAPITVSDAEVRSGPTTDPKFYPTNRLRRGDVVQVLKERQDGWLEIRPPEGSFSWINTRFITQPIPTQPNNFVVVAPGGAKVPVLMGGALGQGKPTVVGAALLQGTMVHRYQNGGQAGAPFLDPEGTWMPIEPPAAEVRFLRYEAIAKAPATVPAAAQLAIQTQPAGSPPASSFMPTPGSQPAAAPSDKPTHAEVEELYQKAVAAERAGYVQMAIQLYAKAGSLGLTINSPVVPEAIARAHFLINASSPVAQAAAPQNPTNPMVAEPAAPPSARLTRPTAPATGVEQPLTTTSATFTTSRQQATSNATSPWVGRLRRAGRVIGTLPTYVLESADGRPILYANGVTGVNLEAYLGQYVELIGSAAYLGEIRTNHMWVAQVRLAQ
jgi:hypothetical protein